MKILATLQRMVKKVIFETVVRSYEASYVLIFFFIISKVAEKVVRPYTVVQSFGAFLTLKNHLLGA